MSQAVSASQRLHRGLMLSALDSTPSWAVSASKRFHRDPQLLLQRDVADQSPGRARRRSLSSALLTLASFLKTFFLSDVHVQIIILEMQAV